MAEHLDSPRNRKEKDLTPTVRLGARPPQGEAPKPQPPVLERLLEERDPAIVTEAELRLMDGNR